MPRRRDVAYASISSLSISPSPPFQVNDLWSILKRWSTERALFHLPHSDSGRVLLSHVSSPLSLGIAPSNLSLARGRSVKGEAQVRSEVCRTPNKRPLQGALQGWAKEWSLGLQFFSSCMLRHRLSAGCVATKLNKKSPNLGTTL